MDFDKVPKPWLTSLREKLGGNESKLIIAGLAAVTIAGIFYIIVTVIKENGSIRRIQVTGETIKGIGEAFFE